MCSIMATPFTPFILSEGLIVHAIHCPYSVLDPLLPYVLNLAIIYSHISAYDLLYHSHQCAGISIQWLQHTWVVLLSP